MMRPAFIIPTLTILSILTAVVLWRVIYVALHITGSGT